MNDLTYLRAPQNVIFGKKNREREKERERERVREKQKKGKMYL
jgi:hypothetical protein